MSEKISSKKLIVLRLITALVILIAGEGLRRYLTSFKKPPVKNEALEKVYTVKTLTVSKADHPIFLEGYGIISSSEVINLSSEIAGVITYVNPKVETGLTVSKGEVLFKIQDQDYELAVQREEVRISTLKSQISELKTEIEFSEKNVLLLKKQLTLYKNELERQKDLLKKGVGSTTAQENAERSYINSESAVLTSNQRIAAAKSKIDTVKNQIKESAVAVKLNKNNLEKSVVKSPATLRVTAKYLEEGQLATPGMKLIVLENDQNLEVPVMIPGPDVINWLKLKQEKNNLFESLIQSPAQIFWTESKDKSILASGVLNRIEKYDSGNRMIKGLVQITDLKQVAAPGMFCKIRIAGKTLSGVFKVPRVSVLQGDKLITIVNDRIKIVSIKPLFDTGDFQIVHSDELDDSIIVIDNKLANPIEGLKVQVQVP